MIFKEKTTVLNKEELNRGLTRIAHEILERNNNAKNLALVGIRNRGVYLAQRVSKKIQEIENTEEPPPVGALDITFYRDDLAILPQPRVRKTEINFDVTGRSIILVDDVLFTGRTIRAAMDALMDYGRPSQIQLAVMIDRGHRELPIRADFVGKNIPTSLKEKVQVKLEEEDEIDTVVIGEDLVEAEE